MSDDGEEIKEEVPTLGVSPIELLLQINKSMQVNNISAIQIDLRG
jgi:hypothetical protein